MNPKELIRLSTQDDAGIGDVAVLSYMNAHGWGDGLPVIAPTLPRVEQLLNYAGLSEDDVLGELPPSHGQATGLLVAANAVMAGCSPEHFPVVVAAIEAVADPHFSLLGVNTTTNPVVPLVIVNGPIRTELGLNMSYGVLGPGGPTNAIARAVSLCMINIAGRIPGAGSRATYRVPAGAMCAAEYEEASPWEPLHVERGYLPEQSTVTLMGIAGLSDLCDVWASDGEELATCLGNMMAAQVGTNWIRPNLGEIGLMLCPPHARVLADHFPTKRDLQEYLNEHCRLPESLITQKRGRQMTERDVYFADDKGTLVTHRPEQWLIFVAGGLGGYHSCHLHPFSATYAVTKAVRPTHHASRPVAESGATS